MEVGRIVRKNRMEVRLKMISKKTLTLDTYVLGAATLKLNTYYVDGVEALGRNLCKQFHNII